jgi:hypothetical protein
MTEEVQEQTVNEEVSQETKERDWEADARSMGWKPADEFRGPPEAHVDAQSFVEKGENELPVLRDNMRKLTKKYQDLENTFGEYQSFMDTQNKSLRDKLEAERISAVESGDVEKFQQTQQQIETLDAAPKKEDKPSVDPGIEAAVQKFVADVPQFQTDPTINKRVNELDAFFAGQNLPPEQHFAKIKEVLVEEYPQKMNGTNERRVESPAVSTTARRAAPTQGAKTFDKLPAEAKDQFKKFQKTFKARGVNYTKEQYLENYQWD